MGNEASKYQREPLYRIEYLREHADNLPVSRNESVVTPESSHRPRVVPTTSTTIMPDAFDVTPSGNGHARPRNLGTSRTFMQGDIEDIVKPSENRTGDGHPEDMQTCADDDDESEANDDAMSVDEEYEDDHSIPLPRGKALPSFKVGKVSRDNLLEDAEIEQESTSSFAETSPAATREEEEPGQEAAYEDEDMQTDSMSVDGSSQEDGQSVQELDAHVPQKQVQVDNAMADNDDESSDAIDQFLTQEECNDPESSVGDQKMSEANLQWAPNLLETLRNVLNPKKDLADSLRYYQKLHDKLKPLENRTGLAGHRYLIAVIPEGKELRTISKHGDAVWLVGYSQTTIETIRHMFGRHEARDDFRLLLGAWMTYDQDRVVELDHFNDRLIVLKCKKSKDAMIESRGMFHGLFVGEKHAPQDTSDNAEPILVDD